MGTCPREIAEKFEEGLSPVATKSTNPKAIVRPYPAQYAKDEIRTEFFRDCTRIIHNRAFRRLRHKTQVFVSPDNDHICTRLEHSLHVASIAKTIASVLNLNRELVEAIALGHDLGHSPFGHEGETHLSKLAQEHELEPFHHELHSLRVIDHLDRSYPEHPGLNLTFAVRDGITCHYGEGIVDELKPDRNRNPDELHAIVRGETLPATMEGCVVRFCDRIAYIGRDLEDSITVGIVNKSDIPSSITEVLGNSNRSIINKMVVDLIKSSKDGLSTDDCIRISTSVHEAFSTLYTFSYENIYKNPNVQKNFKYIENAMEQLFYELFSLIKTACEEKSLEPINKRIEHRKEQCIIVLKEFLENDIYNWQNEKPAQLTIDYIAGMTDRFFVTSFEEIYLSKK